MLSTIGSSEGRCAETRTERKEDNETLVTEIIFRDSASLDDTA